MGLLALFSLVTGAWWAAGCERKLLRTAPLERPPPPPPDKAVDVPKRARCGCVRGDRVSGADRAVLLVWARPLRAGRQVLAAPRRSICCGSLGQFSTVGFL